METKTKKIIIGLTGPMAAGHGIIGDYLKKKGFFFSSTSDRIREECRRRGKEITRDSLQNTADELRHKFGPEVLAKRTWNIVKKYPLSVIDSIRNLSEVEFLETKPNFYLIGVTASRKIRYQRLVARNRESDPITWREFLAADKKDFKSGQGKFGRNINACLGKTDLLLHNNKKVKDLEKKVEEWLVDKFK
jgi:dephospho-CoA kinase